MTLFGKIPRITVTLDEAMPDLLELISPMGALPDRPVEAEAFFATLVEQFSNRAALRSHIVSQRGDWFRVLGERPMWIQEAEWQWSANEPMVFVGSIDAPQGTFHDDARFFLFWAPRSGETKCVIQVA
jgi:hypothetical protein